MDTTISPGSGAAAAPQKPFPPAADAAKLRRRVAAKLAYQVGRDPETAGERDWFVAAALAARDRVVDRWMASDGIVNLAAVGTSFCNHRALATAPG